ncbi:MAG: hypothetical protein MHPSP_003582, partial [Paramarteilia canceri]
KITVAQFFEDAITQLDPEEEVEDQYKLLVNDFTNEKQIYIWKSMRLLLQEDRNFFFTTNYSSLFQKNKSNINIANNNYLQLYVRFLLQKHYPDKKFIFNDQFENTDAITITDKKNKNRKPAKNILKSNKDGLILSENSTLIEKLYKSLYMIGHKKLKDKLKINNEEFEECQKLSKQNDIELTKQLIIQFLKNSEKDFLMENFIKNLNNLKISNTDEYLSLFE